MGYPMEHPHKLCCLRQELVDAFVESRYMTFIKVAAYHLQKFGFKNQALQEATVQCIAAAENDETSSQTNGEAKTDESEEKVKKEDEAMETEDSSAKPEP